MSEYEFLEFFDTFIKREGSQELRNWLVKSDFFTAPASTKYHGSHTGGLCEHSLNVYKRLKLLIEHCWPEEYKPSDETIAIVALLHDLCKVNFYVEVKKSRKTGRLLPNGKPEWEDYLGYEIDDRLPYGHGEKSVYIISGFMKLTREEAFAIRFHMGDYSDQNTNKAFQLYPLALLLHQADEQASNLDESIG